MRAHEGKAQLANEYARVVKGAPKPAPTPAPASRTDPRRQGPWGVRPVPLLNRQLNLISRSAAPGTILLTIASPAEVEQTLAAVQGRDRVLWATAVDAGLR